MFDLIYFWISYVRCNRVQPVYVTTSIDYIYTFLYNVNCWMLKKLYLLTSYVYCWCGFEAVHAYLVCILQVWFRSCTCLLCMYIIGVVSKLYLLSWYVYYRCGFEAVLAFLVCTVYYTHNKLVFKRHAIARFVDLSLKRRAIACKAFSVGEQPR